MSFEIDTGTPIQPTAINYVPDWFRDQMDDDADDNHIVHDFAYHLIGALNNPAKIETVRKQTLANWSFWRCVGHEWPEILDEFICSYAEQVLRR